MNVRPAAGDVMKDGRDTQQRSADIDCGLHDVGPDHRRQAAFEGVNQRQHGDDCDGRHFAGAQRDRNDNRNRVNPNAFGRGAGQQK